ncbi:uncharacterized protein AB675_3801 [Cyphellophora attinorum]|uniref:Uncharacterized protein n=1 Tax=Cyphellophora attinorum TaxID=1664694 RepID=A0A0N1GXS6_9EURO|nr:uncharacterized protein AB675_3801 [Phialophora attinorum]KPI35264.1 hypothetical protein AB675_3801 [Phialophora attinorum]
MSADNSPGGAGNAVASDPEAQTSPASNSHETEPRPWLNGYTIVFLNELPQPVPVKDRFLFGPRSLVLLRLLYRNTYAFYVVLVATYPSFFGAMVVVALILKFAVSLSSEREGFGLSVFLRHPTLMMTKNWTQFLWEMLAWLILVKLGLVRFWWTIYFVVADMADFEHNLLNAWRRHDTPSTPIGSRIGSDMRTHVQSPKVRESMSLFLGNDHLSAPIFADGYMTFRTAIDELRMFFNYMRMRRGLAEVAVPYRLIRLDIVEMVAAPKARGPYRIWRRMGSSFTARTQTPSVAEPTESSSVSFRTAVTAHTETSGSTGVRERLRGPLIGEMLTGDAVDYLNCGDDLKYWHEQPQRYSYRDDPSFDEWEFEGQLRQLAGSSPPRAIRFARTLDRTAVGAVVLAPGLISLVFIIIWLAVFLRKIPPGESTGNVQVVVSTAFTIASYLVTAGALITALAAYLESKPPQERSGPTTKAVQVPTNRRPDHVLDRTPTLSRRASWT